jgi:serine/threonine protein kinase/Tol biopolymer transport system component
MALAPGTRIGAYEILASIGAGGMGEVYRARDAKLGRDVALKVLPHELASDSDRRRRFEQEALAASALNHPNVIPVYDVGSDGGTTWIAMELVEGRTLRDVMSAGPLPTKRLLDLAIQIADGLTRAHEAGIVHRDLKPENVMVSRDGHVRILDFGLAKLVEVEGDFTDRVTSPQITRAGTVVGTASYMSPEQAAGRIVDFRSDQFSLGIILYEMATAQKPFHRATGPETLTAILRDTPPPLAPLAAQIPAPLRWIIEERCLAKDKEERYASTRDLLRELRGLRDHLSEASSAAAPAGVSPKKRTVLWAGLGLLALATAFAAGVWLGRGRGDSSQQSEPTVKRVTFRRGRIQQARFAPDGQTILYSGVFGNRRVETFSTRLDSPEGRSVAPPGVALLSLSTTGEMALQLDSRAILGWENIGTLARASLGGGTPREILENVKEADWSPDGRTQAIVRDVGGRQRLEFPVDTVLYETAGYVSNIRVSPKGDLIAFLDHKLLGDNAGSVAVVDRAGKKRVLTEEALATDGLAWAPTEGEIWFAAGHKTELRAVTLSGRERLLWRETGPVGLRDVSRDGRALLSRTNQGREMVGVAPDTKAEQGLTWLDWSLPIDLSDDGRTLLFDEQGEGAGEAYAIYLRKTDGSPAVRLGEGGAQDLSSDGKTVLGISGQSLILLPIGAGSSRTIPLGKLTPHGAKFFPDGKQILLSANEPDRGSRLYIMDAAGGAPRPFTAEGVNPLPRSSSPVSPDGRTVAGLDADRRITLYPVGGGAPRPLRGAERDETAIRWTPDGRGLYVSRPGVPTRVDVVDVATGRRTPWKSLLPGDPAGIAGVSPTVISGDGRSYVYSYTRLTDDLYVVAGLN